MPGFYTGGIGGGVGVDAGAIEESYIALFKSRDIHAVKVFEYAEVLCNMGKLTVDDVAGYINDVLSVTPGWVARHLQIFSSSFVVSVIGSPSLSASKAVQILRDANMSSNDAQSILYGIADNGYYDRLVDIMTANASDASYTSNTTLSVGVNVYRNLSVGSGVTLTLGAGPAVIIANTITNNGIIRSGWVRGAGGASGGAGAGNGGNGAGGMIIIARDITIGTIKADGSAGGNGSTVSTFASGYAGTGGLFWKISDDGSPSGGNGGSAGYNEGIGRVNGGGGGGAGAVGAPKGGNGGSATLTTFTDASSLLKEVFKSAIDWWLVNVIGKSPTSTKSLPSLGGSGGGGGAAADADCAAGGGGGGGGEIIIYGTSVTAGTITAIGGAGGNGGTEDGYDSGGGGGGGGYIYVLYKTLSGTFTLNVSGGAAGTGRYNGSAGETGVARTIAV
jgi:hypothetical protein